jgi:antitoxin (DNA-binding transcriptional repressor) of toxin-antitoxin stability system
MTYTIALEDAQTRTMALIEQAAKGDEIVLMRGTTPFARIMPPAASATPEARTDERGLRFGMGKGSILFIADDFDAPMEDFREYV